MLYNNRSKYISSRTLASTVKPTYRHRDRLENQKSLPLIKHPRMRSHAAVDDCDDEDTSTGSVSSDSGRWNHSEGAVVRGTSGRPHVTVLGRSSKRRARRDAATAGGKSAPASFRSRDAASSSPAAAGQSAGGSTAASGTHTVANGLKMAQTQAIAVARYLADVDSQQLRVCPSCIPHRASFHGRGD